MCLPSKSDQSSSSAAETGAVVGIGALMILACFAGPAIGALGVGALGVGAGGAILALGLCLAVPAAALGWRRRAAHRTPDASST